MAKSPRTCRCFNKIIFLRSAETSGALRVGCKAKLQRNSARFGGKKTMKDHGNKPVELDSLIKSSRCRYRNVRPHSLPAESHSFVGMARETAAMPPACGEKVVENPLSRVGHTHTHTRVAEITRGHKLQTSLLRGRWNCKKGRPHVGSCTRSSMIAALR